MDLVSITYRIKLDEENTEVFDFNLDAETFDLVSGEIAEAPKWAKLEFKQCSHCPLSVAEHEYCPLALQLHRIVDRFHHTKSIDEVEMEVITDERRIIQTTAIQRAIASMLDLVFPICGCPKTEHMKPMARFHLPLASEEETIFRVTGMYLLAQYFLSVSRKGGSIQFDGLARIYEDMHILNVAVASRLQAATRSDSAKNAITLLDMYSTLVPVLLEDELAEMRCFFKAYLPEGEAEVVSTNYLEKAKAFSLELVPLEEEKEEDKDDDDGRPDWLKQVTAEKSRDGSLVKAGKDAANEKPVVTQQKSSVADEIIKKSGLVFELEPIKEPDDAEVSAEPDGKKNQKIEMPSAIKKPEPAQKKPSVVGSLGLSLSLEPIASESPEEMEAPAPLAKDIPDQPKTTRATFKLPDN